MTQASGEYFVLTLIPHEVVFGLIAFAVLYVLMSRVLLPRLDRVYDERHDRIEGGFERAEQKRAEARRVLDEYHARIGEAREEATRIRDAAREEGERQSEVVLSQAREDAAATVADGRARIDDQAATLRSELRPDVARLSRGLAGRLLGRSVGEDEFADTVDGYLTQRA